MISISLTRACALNCNGCGRRRKVAFSASCGLRRRSQNGTACQLTAPRRERTRDMSWREPSAQAPPACAASVGETCHPHNRPARSTLFERKHTRAGPPCPRRPASRPRPPAPRFAWHAPSASSGWHSRGCRWAPRSLCPRARRRANCERLNNLCAFCDVRIFFFELNGVFVQERTGEKGNLRGII